MTLSTGVSTSSRDPHSPSPPPPGTTHFFVSSVIFLYLKCVFSSSLLNPSSPEPSFLGTTASLSSCIFNPESLVNFYLLHRGFCLCCLHRLILFSLTPLYQYLSFSFLLLFEGSTITSASVKSCPVMLFFFPLSLCTCSSVVSFMHLLFLCHAFSTSLSSSPSLLPPLLGATGTIILALWQRI